MPSRNSCVGDPRSSQKRPATRSSGSTSNRADLNLDGRLAYGVLHDPGWYGTTLTRPRFFGDYYRTQLGILLATHRQPLAVGLSDRPIPLPFMVEDLPGEIPPERAHEVQHLFAMPDLSRTDDAIANGTRQPALLTPRPLALFSAERVDYSLHRLHHYTGTGPEFFQRFVLLTNYQRYVEHFRAHARRELLEGDEYDRLVEPGNVRPPERATEFGAAQRRGPAPSAANARLPPDPAGRAGRHHDQYRRRAEQCPGPSPTTWPCCARIAG